jgi:hypothetical protein
MFCLIPLFHIDLGLGEIKITFEDLISAVVGSLLCIFAWRLMPSGGGPKSNTPTTFFYEASDNSSDLNWTAHRLAGDGVAVVPHQRHAIVGLPRYEGDHIV